MAMKTPFYFVTLLFLLYYGSTNAQLSKEEELNLANQFKLLQKPSMKSIKTEYGDIYDCVDFYKQPAFDHPLLKNHTFHPEMKPSCEHERISTYSNGKESLNDIRLKNGGCPKGTVPIRRITKEQFIATKRFTKNYASRTKPNGDPVVIPGEHFAILRTTSPSTMKYNGARGEFSIHSLPVTQSQYTLARLKLENGHDSIQVGWMINPTVNKDNLTRLFQYLYAGQSHCYNTQCPGFVHVNPKIPIDGVLRTSIRGGHTYITNIFIYRNSVNGNWWLSLGRDSDMDVVGFWPAKIFTAMASPATYVSVGGEAYGPPDQPLPPMGNGYIPVPDTAKSAYCSNLVVLDENDKYILDPPDMGGYSDSANYFPWDVHFLDKIWGRVLLYGGTVRQKKYMLD